MELILEYLQKFFMSPITWLLGPFGLWLLWYQLDEILYLGERLSQRHSSVYRNIKIITTIIITIIIFGLPLLSP